MAYLADGPLSAEIFDKCLEESTLAKCLKRIYEE